MSATFLQGDAARLPFQSGIFDIVIGSPPYGPQRLYLEGEEDLRIARDDVVDWVEWMLPVTEEALRVSKGLVCWVVSGWQEDNNYMPAPEGLAWEWFKRGGHQWAPCCWWKVDEQHRGVGIPGSGQKQGLRKDWEYVLMFKPPGTLPHADNTAMGRTPIYAKPGGPMSNRTRSGRRTNDPWNLGNRKCGASGRERNGEKRRPTMQVMNGNNKDGTLAKNRTAPMPAITNPGNFIVCARVGGGQMGDSAAYEGEAAFPERLPEFFIRTYTKVGDKVLDPFSGTGTTASVAKRWGRIGVGMDLRASQCELGISRSSNVQVELFPQDEAQEAAELYADVPVPELFS